SSGNYNFTLTATAGYNTDLSGTATVDISIQAAQLQMYESDGSTVLGHSSAVTSGGWVLENSNDYNYALTSSNSLIPADQQTAAVAGDAALLKLGTTAGANSAAGGQFELVASGNLGLWQNADRTGAVTGTTNFSTTSPSTLYVEGKAVSASQGSDYVTLNWKTPGGITLQLDQVKYSVYAITGAENVPEGGAYTYAVQLPNGVTPGNAWSVTDPGDGIFAGTGPIQVQVSFDNTIAEVVSVQYSPATGFTGDWNVNAVEIQVSAGTVTPPTGKAVPPPPQTTFSAGGYVSVTAPDDITFSNSVTVTGPNGGWGVTQMNIGYMQEDTIVTEDGTYQDGTTLKSNLGGQTYTDWVNAGPWSNSALTPANPGQGVYVAFFQPTSNGQQVTLNHYDLPTLTVPATNKATGSPLLSTNLFDTFVRYVAAETNDTANDANNIYVGLAEANWQTNYQLATQNGKLTPTANQAITSSAAFSQLLPGLPITVTATSANTAAGGETWRQAGSPAQPGATPVPAASGSGGVTTLTATKLQPLDVLGSPIGFPPIGFGWGNWLAPAADGNLSGILSALAPAGFPTSLLGDWLWYV
ncbi:MAG: hypothetical protein HKL95_02470, partial [Phycisphaerae bacterium]|nr:hypothetical protein [Phycisphaerae bacterium]